MATRKHSKFTAILLSLIMGIVLVCSTALVAAADAQSFTAETITATLTQEAPEYATSGIDANNVVYELVADPDPATAQRKLETVVKAYQARMALLGYTDEVISAQYEAGTVAMAKQVRDQALEAGVLTQAMIVGAGSEQALTQWCEALEAAVAQMVAIKLNDENQFNEWQAQQAKAVGELYKNLRGANDNGGTAQTVVGAYEAAKLAALEAAYALYVTESVVEEATVYAFVNAVAYSAADVAECAAQVEAIKAEAEAALKGVNKNVIEDAYDCYMDWVNDATADKAQVAKAEGQKAVNFYNGASEEIKAHYSGEYAVINQFLENIDEDPFYVPGKVSTLRNKGVTVTAVYSNGDAAEIFPENCTLVVYASANAPAKRNATNLIKKEDNKLSVAYFIYIAVYKAHKEYDLSSVSNVEYQVSIDLNEYYDNFCKEKGYEQDKLSNITEAAAAVAGGTSICYSYANNAVEGLEYTLNGGSLVFTTTHFSNFCVAGTGLDSLFHELWFWVALIVVLIILIWIIKLLVKHVRYSIKFITNGGSSVAPIYVAKKEAIVLPEAPVKEGYVFAGWFTDKDLTCRFIETHMRRRRAIKLYAKWASPLTQARLLEMYEVLRDKMKCYKKESFKSLLGLTETELIASMYLRENHVQLNLSLNPEELKSEGYNVTANKDKKFAEVPTLINISTEALFEEALTLTKRALLNKGLQKIEDYVPCELTTEEERKNGFAYFVRNERVASTAEDYVELLRIALKSYVLEKDTGAFKPGDKVTLARVYITNEEACLHLPIVKGDKVLGKPSREVRFSDTPVVVRILAPRDMLEAYAMIDKVMCANGFAKCPENSNNLTDVKLPATNGFAYTLKF